MTTLLWILIGVAWYAIGVGGFIYGLTREFDFTTSEIGAALWLGVGGIITFIASLCVFSNEGNKRTLIKQRKT